VSLDLASWCLVSGRAGKDSALGFIWDIEYIFATMALSIKDPEADRLARELAARTGETLTEAIVVASSSC
jgi:hypothetical protein